MNLMAKDSAWRIPDGLTSTGGPRRDAGIDTMRGIAILMVIGIHSLQQPLGSWAIPLDASLRPLSATASGEGATTRSDSDWIREAAKADDRKQNDAGG